jgi:hypothetical protein
MVEEYGEEVWQLCIGGGGGYDGTVEEHKLHRGKIDKLRGWVKGTSKGKVLQVLHSIYLVHLIEHKQKASTYKSHRSHSIRKCVRVLVTSAHYQEGSTNMD